MFLFAGGNAVTLRNHHRRDSEKVFVGRTGSGHTSSVIPGRAKGTSPESSMIGISCCSEFRGRILNPDILLNWVSGPAAYKKEFGLVGVTAQRGR